MEEILIQERNVECARRRRVAGLGLKALVFFILFCGLHLRALDPSRSIHQYGHDQWTRRIGLPGTTVEALYQSPDGYLWLASAGALFRFDGKRFTPMPLAPGLRDMQSSESLRAVGPARSHGWLLRTAQHTLRLEFGRLQEAAPNLKVPDGLDRKVLETEDGCIWIGTDNHIFRMKNGKLELIAKGVGWVRDMVVDQQGGLWISTSAALYRIQQDRILALSATQCGAAQVFLPIDVNASPKGIVFPQMPTALLEDKEGTLWIGTLGGLRKWKHGALVDDAESRAYGTSPVMALCQDRHGNLWVGSDGGGLSRLTHHRWSRLTTQEGLSDNSVKALLEDQEGDLWIGTCNGLDQLRDVPICTVTARDGLLDDNLCTVTEGSDGALYAYALGGTVARLKDGAITTFTSRDGLVCSYSGCLYTAKDGTLWAGSGRGLCALDKGHWRTFTAGGKLSNLFISAITEDDESLILACSDLNLYRFKQDRLTPYNLRLARPEDIRYVFTMFRDTQDTLWFGTSAGLYRLAKGQDPSKAVPTAFRDPAISLSDDARGGLWITGRDTPGFTRLDKQNGLLTRFTPEIGAVPGSIGRILSDDVGNLWMSTRKGIVTYSRAELDAFAAQRRARIHGMTYDSMDGLRTDDCADNEKQPAAWRMRSGLMAFTSPRGLALIDPAKLTRNLLAPPVHIEEVLVDGNVLPSDAHLEIAPGQKNIEIRYSANSLQLPSRVQFKYRLEGYDRDWVDAANRQVAYYTKVPPGRYIFRVVAANNDGLWNTQGASIALHQKPRFYQTLWFMGLAVLALAGLILAIHRFRVRLHIRTERELQARIREATDHIQALHGLLPICAWCRKVRDDAGDWQPIEHYIANHSRTEFSHGICPECKKHMVRHGHRIRDQR